MKQLNSLRNAELLFYILIALSGFFLIVFFSFYNFDTSKIFFANDQATDFIVARYASKGNYPLLGPPSHTGGRHLGPMYYWFVILTAWLTSFDIYNASVLFISLKLFSVLILFTFARFFLKGLPLVFFVLALVLSLLSISYLETFREQWHSNFLFIPSMLATLSSLAIIKYGARLFPAFFVAQSILLQSHLSAGPAVLGQCLIVVIYCLLPSNRPLFFSTIRSIAFLITLFFTCAMWLPTLLYELRYPSNLGKLFAVHSSSGKKHLKAGFDGAFEALTDFFKSHSFYLPDYGIWAYVYILIVAGFIFNLILLILKGDKKEKWAILLLFSPLIMTACFLSFFKAPLYQHYFNSSIIAPPLIFAFVIAYAAKKFETSPSRNELFSYFFIILITAIILGLPYRVRAAYKRYSGRTFEPIHSYQHAKDLIDFIKNDAKSDNPMIYTRMSAAHSRNALYYLIKNGHPEIEYKRFFKEYPDFSKDNRESTANKAYLVICPSAFRTTERTLIRSFSKRWTFEIRLTPVGNSSINKCSIVKLSKLAKQIK